LNIDLGINNERQDCIIGTVWFGTYGKGGKMKEMRSCCFHEETKPIRKTPSSSCHHNNNTNLSIYESYFLLPSVSYVRNIDGHTCAFPQYQNVLNNNESTCYINFVGFNSPSSTEFT
jgi:hypothetical protein